MAAAAAAGTSVEALTDAMRTRLAATHVELVDVSGGCGQMFEAVIVSARFAGKPALARHRLANAALAAEIAAVHAWSQKLFTPEEWARRQQLLQQQQQQEGQEGQQQEQGGGGGGA
ncbi:bola domain-containing protein [Sphaerosporella brunnea]|uniref:Bola domain-containing protein n=1 Tax=Sphaerosporella brunnea TaxID=1250544 RepID=A0A5J5F9K5_9PEZI|nr:bola domain-containing protein [Sphaerosporella brunnea]